MLARLFQKPPTIAEGYASAALATVIARKTAAMHDPAALDAAVPGALRLPTLLAAALAGDRVLDFGGAAGLHYLVARRAFPQRRFRWAVIETPVMCIAAAALAAEDLRFFPTVSAAQAWLGGVDLVHSVSALQYTAAPEHSLAELVAIAAPLMLWAKLALGETRAALAQHSRLSDNGPGPLPADLVDGMVAYTVTRLRQADFMAAHAGYDLRWHDGTSAFLFAR